MRWNCRKLPDHQVSQQDNKWFSQDKGRFLLVVTTPKVKLTWLDLRTRQCCHEHASEIFTIYPATCEPLGIFATGNEYNNLKVHFRVKGSELRTAPRFPGQLPVMTECGKGLTRDLSSN